MVLTRADIQDLVVSVQRLTPSTIEFDLVGVDASIANALRRVMIAEVSWLIQMKVGWS
jgi:DNA-directed RNA polymerase alpha subunit